MLVQAVRPSPWLIQRWEQAFVLAARAIFGWLLSRSDDTTIGKCWMLDQINVVRMSALKQLIAGGWNITRWWDAWNETLLSFRRLRSFSIEKQHWVTRCDTFYSSILISTYPFCHNEPFNSLGYRYLGLTASLIGYYCCISGEGWFNEW